MGPQINVIGSLFPTWMVCAIVGIIAAFLGRRLFVRTGLDPHLGPRIVVYPSLAVLVTLVLWTIFCRG